MERVVTKANYIFYFIILLIITGSLCSSNIFIYRSLTSFFCYSVGVCIVLIYAAIVTLFNQRHDLSLSWPSLFATLFGSYVILHGFFFSSGSYPLYLAGNCCFLLAIFTIIRVNRPNINIIYNLILVTAIAESVICLLQYFHLLKSLNPYFSVTGSWENPNVTAMFIAMSSPCVIPLFYQKNTLIKKTGIFISAVLSAVLLLLACRTALVGVVLWAIILLNNQYRLLAKARSKKNRTIAILILLMSSGILFGAGNYIYQAKKASADGRKLIWKISAEMVAHQPLFGYGYGTFERNYNLFQSRYFQEGNGSADEIKNAGFVKMGYNEALQNWVEGGLIGLLLLIATILSLLYALPKNSSKDQQTDKTSEVNPALIAYSGVAAFSFMSVLNFTIQAIPVMCLFVIYGATLSAHSVSKNQSTRVSIMVSNLQSGRIVYRTEAQQLTAGDHESPVYFNGQPGSYIVTLQYGNKIRSSIVFKE